MIENLIRKQYDIILDGPSGGHDKQIKKSERVLIAEFREVFDASVNLIINDVEKIPQEKSGKYRFSICKI